MGSDPITSGNLTFTFVESSGFAKSAVSVEVSQVGLNYALTFTGLSGNVAGIEDPPSPDGTELRYTVQVTSGSAVFDAVGLQVAATPAVSTTTSWYSGYFHTDAALPQTLANSGSVAGIDVDGSQATLHVLLDPDLTAGGKPELGGAFLRAGSGT